MFKKTVLLSLVVLAVLAFNASPVLADSRSEIDRYPLSLIIYNPCANEDVLVEGTLLSVERWYEDANGGWHASFHITPQNFTGVGLTSGAEYVFSGTVHEMFTWNWPNIDRAETETFIDQHRLISKGVSENSVIQETYHFTLNANGDGVTFHYDLKIMCQ